MILSGLRTGVLGRRGDLGRSVGRSKPERCPSPTCRPPTASRPAQPQCEWPTSSPARVAPTWQARNTSIPISPQAVRTRHQRRQRGLKRRQQRLARLDQAAADPRRPGVDNENIFGGAGAVRFNMACCDGDVHRISYGIDPNVYRRLGVRNDRDPMTPRNCFDSRPPLPLPSSRSWRFGLFRAACFARSVWPRRRRHPYCWPRSSFRPRQPPGPSLMKASTSSTLWPPTSFRASSPSPSSVDDVRGTGPPPVLLGQLGVLIGVDHGEGDPPEYRPLADPAGESAFSLFGRARTYRANHNGHQLARLRRRTKASA